MPVAVCFVALYYIIFAHEQWIAPASSDCHRLYRLSHFCSNPALLLSLRPPATPPKADLPALPPHGSRATAAHFPRIFRGGSKKSGGKSPFMRVLKWSNSTILPPSQIKQLPKCADSRLRIGIMQHYTLQPSSALKMQSDRPQIVCDLSHARTQYDITFLTPSKPEAS